MKKALYPLSFVFFAAVLALSCVLPALGAGQDRAQALDRAAAYLVQAVPAPQVSATGGEWAVVALARCGRLSGEQRAAYLANLSAAARQGQGVLSARKYTEYARAVLALTALGEDPRRVAGYDLLAPLEDLEAVVRQGLNGAVFALIALDSGPHAAPEGLRENYVQFILDAQLPGGGWALTGTQADPDVTAQAVQALAPYAQEEPVRAALAVGRDCLARLWAEGAFLTLESHAQALIALTALGAEPPQGWVDGLLAFQLPGGAFAHLPGGGADQMATEQGLCALAALERQAGAQSPLYRMEDAAPRPDAPPDTLPAARPGPDPRALARRDQT